MESFQKLFFGLSKQKIGLRFFALFKNKYFLVPTIFIFTFVLVFAVKYITKNQVQASGVTITNSERFNGTNAYLSRTLSSGNRQTFTISTWVKRSGLASSYCPFGSFDSAALNVGYICFVGGAGDTIEFSEQTSSLYTTVLRTTAQFRDPSAWYNLVVAVDTTQATASNRVKMYVNGTQITSFIVATYPSQNYSYYFNNAGDENRVGKAHDAGSTYFPGYISDMYLVDGQALTPTSFATQDTTTGQWVPISYSGSYGTNGFHLQFNASSTPGTDTSGLGNNFTNNNLAVTDQVQDTPTNNFATLNPLFTPLSGVSSVKEGNLSIYSADNSNTWSTEPTFALPSSGKYYLEYTLTAGSTSGHYLGIVENVPTSESHDYSFGRNSGILAGSVIYEFDTFTPGYIATRPSGGSLATVQSGLLNTQTAGDVIGAAVDLDNNLIYFYKNGIQTGTAQSIAGLLGRSSNGWSFFFAGHRVNNGTVNFGQGGQSGLTYDSASGGSFKYTPPTGYKALSSNNLPTPAVAQGFSYFDSTKYTGTGASQSITGFAFQPDIVWLKDMTSPNLSGIWDSVRNVVTTSYGYLSSNTTTALTTTTTGVTAFLSNGFTIGSNSLFNTNTNSYIAWLWKEDPVAGFDIVTYTGTGANRTVSHSLAATPEFMIVKRTDSTGLWATYHQNLTSPTTQYLDLSSTGGVTTDATMWNSTSPTTSVFSLGTNAAVNASGGSYIAYLFKGIDGYSKFGSYTGNGSTDGPFVYTGFKPKYVMIKKSSATDDWVIYDTARDTYNVTTSSILANTSAAKTTVTGLDILSNGFKIRNTTSNFNTAAATYVYAAFAENPFQQSAQVSNVGGLSIASSTRFGSVGNSYLDKTLTTPTNNKIMTFSMWVKPDNIGAHTVFRGWSGGSVHNGDFIIFGGGTITIYNYLFGSGGVWGVTSQPYLKDPSAWHHVVVSVDTTQATASNRVRIYVDGVETIYNSPIYPSQNFSMAFNSAIPHYIGTRAELGGYDSYYGYLSDVYMIDGQQLTPTSFGEYDTNGYWRPKTYSGTYGTNGFHLPLTSTSPGTDTSGNGNNFTNNNIAVTDNVKDSPTNDFATLNPLNMAGLSDYLSSGNLAFNAVTSGNVGFSTGNIAVSSGKWYWEGTASVSAGSLWLGICPPGALNSGNLPCETINGLNGYGYRAFTGFKANNGSQTAYGSSWTVGDTIGIAYDADNRALWFSKNGVWQAGATTGEIAGGNTTNAAFTNIPATLYTASTGHDGYTSQVMTMNFGQGGQSGLTYNSASGGYFKYTPPTGFKALSTNNLTASTIPKGSSYFDAKTYTGTGASQSITSANFLPALVWIKDLTSANSHGLFSPQILAYSSLAYLTSTSNLIETTLSSGLSAFLSSGFTIGSSALFNTNTNNYVAWAWKKSATAGIDVVSYTGIGSSATVAQSIATNGALDWQTYTIGGNTYALVANNFNDSTGSINSYNFIWQSGSSCFGNGTTCGTALQNIATIGATGWKTYTIGANTYALVANGATGSTNSSNYIWQSGSSCFGNGTTCGTQLQSIATNGARDWETYTIGANTYALVANYYNGSSYNISSFNYIWQSGSSCFGNGTTCGTALQNIATNAASDWQTYTIGANTYALVANKYNGSTFNTNSANYIWQSGSSCWGDGTTCGTPLQNFATNGAADWNTYTIGANTYALVANSYNDSTFSLNSANYIWQSGSSCFGNGTTCGTALQNIATAGAQDWQTYTVGSNTYALLANGATGSTNSSNYIWQSGSSCFGNGTTCGTPLQNIATNGSVDWETFVINTKTYSLVSNQYNGSTYNVNSSLYTWNGSCWGASSATSSACGNGGSGAIIGHSLTTTPTFMMIKDRTTANNWSIYHSGLSTPNTQYLTLNSTAAETTNTTMWNSATPTASTFNVGTNASVNTSGDNYIAYLFSDVDGFSKFSTYTGNGSTDGPFVYTGFKPRFIMIKRKDSTGNWVQLDTARDNFNVATSTLLANTTAAQTVASTIDFLSNGFKVRNTGADYNTSGATYVYAAFAEQPFKYGAGANIATSSAMGSSSVSSVISTVANWFWSEF